MLQAGFESVEKARLYRRLDRLLEHKRELFVYLKQKWADLFGADFEELLYDLTSTYFEGEMEQNSKALAWLQRGYSRDGPPDCVQLVIAPMEVSRCGACALGDFDGAGHHDAFALLNVEWMVGRFQFDGADTDCATAGIRFEAERLRVAGNAVGQPTEVRLLFGAIRSCPGAR